MNLNANNTTLAHAVACHVDGDLDKAEQLYDRLLKTSPDHPELLHMRGILARQKGHLRAAEKLIRKAIHALPGKAEFYCSLADVYLDEGRFHDTILWNKKALDIEPGHSEAHIRIAEAYERLGEIEKTVRHYKKGLTPDSRDDRSCFNLGLAFQKLGRYSKAIEWYQRAVGLNPDFADAYNNMGNSYRVLGNDNDAVKNYQKALQRDPGHLRALNNLGKTFQDQGRSRKALACYDRAIKIKPDYAEARFNRSIALLQTGELQEGFREYEWRFQRSRPETIYPYQLNIPRWNGEPFKGRTLLVHSEQGFGDTIHFMRYLPMVKARGGRIVFEVLEPLRKLLENTPAVDRITPFGSGSDSLQEPDFYIPLMSIPAVFNTTLETIPNEIPYIFPDPQRTVKWKHRLDHPGFKIGLTWAGKLSHEDDHNRSCGLEVFLPVLKRPDVKLYGLQKEADDKWGGLSHGETEIENIGERFEDFADTAGAIHHLDLIITVDTAMAHLAGAMGKRVWTLLAFNPDWRWLRDQPQTPWYPTMRLFRQPKKGDWEALVRGLLIELDGLLARELTGPTGGSAVNRRESRIRSQIEKGFELFRKGEPVQAENTCQKILQEQPNHSKTHHLLGIIYLGKQDYRKAKQFIRQAITSDPKVAIYHASLGDVFHKELKFHQAIESYGQAVMLDPGLTEAHYNMGNAFFDAGDPDQAVRAYQMAVGTNSEFYQAYFNMGNALKDSGREEGAVQAYQKAIEMNPELFEAWYNLGTIFQGKKDLEQAEKCYQRALSIRPGFSAAHNNLGSIFQESNRFGEAIESYQNAIRHDPEYADGYYNLGKIYQDFHQFEKAVAEYRSALDIDPGHHKALCNLGRAFHNMARFEDAVTCYEKALALKPDYVEAHFNLSLSQLIMGRFNEGWEAFEWRLKREEWKRTYPHRYQVPKWDGCEFKGKTLLVHCEQGIGDSLNFVRYLPMVKERGGRVIFESRESLLTLFKDLPGVDQLIGLSPTEKTGLEYDLYVPLMSLPGIFNTGLDSIPAGESYIRADLDKINHWGHRIGKGPLNVGLVWAGSGVYPSRSCPLVRLSILSRVEGVHFYGLQKGPPTVQLEDERIPPGFIIENLGDAFQDFSDTAAAIHHLDLIISVDTSVAHLAGAMGKPVWLMLPFVGDWRWMFNTDKNPWYPGMTLFRQDTPGDWETVCVKMARELKKQVAPNNPRVGLGPDSELSSPGTKTPNRTGKSGHAGDTRKYARDDERHFQASIESWKKKELDQALSLIDRAILIRPDFPPYHCQRGLYLVLDNRKKEAAEAFQTAITFNPLLAEAHFNLGLIFREQGRNEKAMESFEQALKCDPDQADACYNMGNISREQGRIERSINYYRQAISLRPAFPWALNNLGLSYREMGLLEKAIEKYTLARDMDPAFAEAYWNRAIAYLLKGDFKAGWRDFEWRFKRGSEKNIYPYKIPLSRWNGQPFKGKRLFVHSEQGFGDTIQFIRFLPMVKKRGGTVLFETMAELRPLLDGFNGIDELNTLSSHRGAVDQCDFYVPILSLPLLLDITLDSIPCQVPYIRAAPRKAAFWRQRINPTGFRVGLVWAGKPGHGNDHNRSCPLELFRELTRLPGARFLGLQKGRTANPAAGEPGRMGIDNLGEEFKDFSDTAGALENLDLIISVDTSVAHLAGAMGKPVWTLIPHAPDWRWLQHGERSPWYPTMKLFRQSSPGDWKGVLKQVAEQIHQTIHQAHGAG